jgi:hypothetical protein
VRRIHEGEEEADRDRFDPFGEEPVDRMLEGRHVDRRLDLAGRLDRFDDALPARPWREEAGRLRLEEQLVDLAPVLPTDLDHILEACRREETEPRAFAFQHRVGGDRGAVNEPLDAGGSDAPIREQSLQDSAHRRAWIGTGGGHLRDVQAPTGCRRNDVGEGTADIYPDCGHSCP